VKRLSLLLFILLIPGCTKDTTPINQNDPAVTTFPHSMKGWELYSWPVGYGWKYSILMGTNRLKSYEEVIGGTVVVTGKDSLKSILDRFPEGESITWLGRGWLESCWGSGFNDLSLPPQNIVDEIRQYCTARKLIFEATE
jgi:hypothetical protein